MAWKQHLIKWMEDNRGLVVIVFCLPASFIFDLGLRLKNWFYRAIASSPKYHNNRVNDIQRKVFIQTLQHWLM